jgi:hypothetical protein
MQFFSYGEGEFIPCEVTGQRANDVHHISARGMGGSDEKDFAENLCALTRRVHDLAESEKILEDTMKAIHMSFIDAHKKGTDMAMKLHYAKVKQKLAEVGITEKDLK